MALGSNTGGYGIGATSGGLAQMVGMQQAAQQTAPKENTQLEAHLFDLRSLQEELAGAASRAEHIADRLLGVEPTPLQGNGGNNLKEPAEPPLLARIASAHQIVKELAARIHYHLNRLERL